MIIQGELKFKNIGLVIILAGTHRRKDAFMDKVFISYSSKEYQIADSFRKAFTEYGLKCWMAPESIPIGSNYAVEIPRAIEDADVFVLILSENSQNSVWVRKEIDLAVNLNKLIFPIKTGNYKLISPFNFYLTNVQMMQTTEEPNIIAEKLSSLINPTHGRNIVDDRHNDCLDEEQVIDYPDDRDGTFDIISISDDESETEPVHFPQISDKPSTENDDSKPPINDFEQSFDENENTIECDEESIVEQFTEQQTDMDVNVNKAAENEWLSRNELSNLSGVANEVSYYNSFDDLRNALNSGKSVIVEVDVSKCYGQYSEEVFSPADSISREVQVVGIDESDSGYPMVILNDCDLPNGVEKVPVDVFMEAWAEVNNRMITAG